MIGQVMKWLACTARMDSLIDKCLQIRSHILNLLGDMK